MNSETGFFRQTYILFQRDVELFINNFKKILSTFGFPILIGILIIFVSNNELFETYDSTKSFLFTIVCAGIYVGMFNSLTIVVKERKIIKREYMTNMKISAYICAQVILQAIICFLQSLIFMAVYWFTIDFPTEGLVFSESFLDYLISLFLVMFVSDLMGLLISTMVRTSEMANLVAPILIIIQLVLCGVLFSLEGNSEYISYFTVSKWGMDSIGSISALNDLPLDIQEEFPMIPHEAEDIFEATKEHVIFDWFILIIFIIVLISLSILILKRVEKDTR